VCLDTHSLGINLGTDGKNQKHPIMRLAEHSHWGEVVQIIQPTASNDADEDCRVRSMRLPVDER